MPTYTFKERGQVFFTTGHQQIFKGTEGLSQLYQLAQCQRHYLYVQKATNLAKKSSKKVHLGNGQVQLLTYGLRGWEDFRVCKKGLAVK